MTKFTNQLSNQKANAQYNLAGLTNYVNDDTLRFFKARILVAYATSCGNYFILVESLPVGGFNAPRQKRSVVFNTKGATIFTSKAVSKTDKAKKLAYEFIDSIDQ